MTLRGRPEVDYVGRFAPSPTGPLHWGSLTTAVASYLDARRAGGKWLLRIEDIDPPREPFGAADAIQRTLDRLALHWDGPVLYQSSCLARYEATVRDLLGRGLAFQCSCTRSELRGSGLKGPLGYRYAGLCRAKKTHHRATSVRARVEPGVSGFEDRLQGSQQYDLAALSGDYVIWRRDKLPAYHLAVVLDDAAQQVSDVVRGVDLLSCTPVHLHLQQLLGLPAPRYAHLPVVVNEKGQKLSKQTRARAVDATRPGVGQQVLSYLGLDVPAQLADAAPEELWKWATSVWTPDSLRGRTQIHETPPRSAASAMVDR